MHVMMSYVCIDLEGACLLWLWLRQYKEVLWVTCCYSNNHNHIVLILIPNTLIVINYLLLVVRITFSVQNCMSYESWSCLSVETVCPDPGTPNYGRRQLESLLGGSTVHYSCFDGYTLVGESKRTCRSGRWTGSLPACIGECLGVADWVVDLGSVCTSC